VVSAPPLQYLVSGNNQFSRVNIERLTAAEALKKGKGAVGARLLGRENYARHEVKSCCPMSLIDSKDSEPPKSRGKCCEVDNERKVLENGP
jgi:hypothetical protein